MRSHADGMLRIGRMRGEKHALTEVVRYELTSVSRQYSRNAIFPVTLGPAVFRRLCARVREIRSRPTGRATCHN